MRCQIDNGILTYYTKGLSVGSTIPTTPEIDAHIQAIGEYCMTQRKPEQVAVDQANELTEQAQAQAQAAQAQATEANQRADQILAELSAILQAFEEWQSDTEYQVGQIIQYGGRLYTVVQAHTSQDDWLPDALPALYRN